MKYFMDCEFIEGWKKPIKWLPTIGNFNKPYHSIQLISIGIVSEDGRTYYAISNEFNQKDASEWVKDNVLTALVVDKILEGNSIQREMFTRAKDNVEHLKSAYGKSCKLISQEIFRFVNDVAPQSDKLPIEFYAYYADYDWVLFCSLFGTMMDLPKGFPKYCKDLKQMLDEDCLDDSKWKGACNGFEKRLGLLKSFSSYPKQTNEHNALADAKWNFELYKFLTALK